MGAWRDFLANPTPINTSNSPSPPILQYLKSRPIRTLSLVLTTFILLSVFFVPSESLPSLPSTNTFKSASSWIPSFSYLRGGKDIERYDLQHDGAMKDISVQGWKEPVYEKDERTGLLYPQTSIHFA
ncbi:hypothetical protein BT69DRAFT_844316 [Atractiella rhizophila]|nr:hypothetical protein BT69DRAFT_844316 [Atractiella rhizophila]